MRPIIPIIGAFFSLLPLANAQTFKWIAGPTRVMHSVDTIQLSNNTLTVKTPNLDDSLGVYPLTRKICYRIAVDGFLSSTPGAYAPDSKDKVAQAEVRKFAKTLTALNNNNPMFTPGTQVSWTYDSKNQPVFSVSQPAMMAMTYSTTPTNETLPLGKGFVTFNPGKAPTFTPKQFPDTTNSKIRVLKGQSLIDLARILAAKHCFSPNLPAEAFFSDKATDQTNAWLNSRTVTRQQKIAAMVWVGFFERQLRNNPGLEGDNPPLKANQILVYQFVPKVSSTQ